MVHFFQDVVGIPCIEPAVLEQRTNAYKAWVRRITDERGIPVLPAPTKGVRKEDFVQPDYRRLKADHGVASVLTSLEQRPFIRGPGVDTRCHPFRPGRQRFRGRG